MKRDFTRVNGCLLILCFLSQSCEQNEQEVIEKLSINPKKARSYEIEELFSQIELIQLKPKDDFIGGVNKIEKIGSSIFILDADYLNSVYEFNEQGEFQNQIGSEGPGPDEYVNINDFSLVVSEKGQSQIWLLDDGTGYISILKYDLSGDFIEKVQTEFFSDKFSFLDSDKLVFSTSGQCNDEFCSSYFITDLELNLKVSGPEASPQYQELWIEPVFPFSTVDGKFAGAEYGKNIIYSHNQYDGFKPLYEIDFGKVKSEAELTKTYSDVDEYFKVLESEYAYHLDDVLLTDDILMFSFRYKNDVLKYLNKNGKEFLIDEIKVGDISFSPPSHVGYTANEIYWYLDEEFLDELFSMVKNKNSEIDLGILSMLSENLNGSLGPVLLKLTF